MKKVNILVVFFATSLALLIIFNLSFFSASNSTKAPVYSPPPLSESPFRNTLQSASYVGSEACVECHQDAHASYLQTAHSQTFREVDPNLEPADGVVTDKNSGRSYRAYRKDDQLRHSEFISSVNGHETVMSDYPIRYVIGSGRFSRSYLAEDHGFLIESPMTWYAASREWSLSPGYDEFNPGFERSAEIRCINCHVGRAEPIDDSPQKSKIYSHTIDCERCHGPGSLHVQSRKKNSDSAPSPDMTIVHTKHLSRELKEAICSQCHMHGAATIDVRGRQLSDFRPGLPLEDFAIHYVLEAPNKSMKVVGHMEQMHLSQCYQKSETLTCISCHSLHEKSSSEETFEIYRSKCLSCHTDQSCGLTIAERIQKNKRDDCVSCHMPTSDTEIPHFAFTHHRIGIHSDEHLEETGEVFGSLVPFEDISHLPQFEQDRCLGLAYSQFANKQKTAESREYYEHQARRLLKTVRAQGLRDPEIDVELAKLSWENDPMLSASYSKLALGSAELLPHSSTSALFTLGSSLYRTNRLTEAIRPLEELVRKKRYSPAWFVLSQCYSQIGELDAALQAAQRAVEISPQNPEYHARLAELYLNVGDQELAKRSRLRSIEMQKLPQKSR